MEGRENTYKVVVMPYAGELFPHRKAVRAK